jgi:hypothetical protein
MVGRAGKGREREKTVYKARKGRENDREREKGERKCIHE